MWVYAALAAVFALLGYCTGITVVLSRLPRARPARPVPPPRPQPAFRPRQKPRPRANTRPEQAYLPPDANRDTVPYIRYSRYNGQYGQPGSSR